MLTAPSLGISPSTESPTVPEAASGCALPGSTARSRTARPGPLCWGLHGTELHSPRVLPRPLTCKELFLCGCGAFTLLEPLNWEGRDSQWDLQVPSAVPEAC